MSNTSLQIEIMIYCLIYMYMCTYKSFWGGGGKRPDFCDDMKNCDWFLFRQSISIIQLQFKASSLIFSEISVSHRKSIERKLVAMFDDLMLILESEDFDKSLRDCLERAAPKYMTSISKRKKDILKSDHGIVIAGKLPFYIIYRISTKSSWPFKRLFVSTRFGRLEFRDIEQRHENLYWGLSII